MAIKRARSAMTAERDALTRCIVVDIHPAIAPLGEGHHTEVMLSDRDREIGDALGYFLGTLFADIPSDDRERFFNRELTSVQEWARVARALRIHKLKIVDA